MTRSQGGEGEGRGRMWMRMTEIAEARLRRTATSYCNIDSLAKEQWPPIEEEGVFTRVDAHAHHHGFRNIKSNQINQSVRAALPKTLLKVSATVRGHQTQQV